LKIEIEISENRNPHSIKIDGRGMSIVYTVPCATKLRGILPPESENTLGGLIAGDLHEKIVEYASVVSAANDIRIFETWDTLDEEALDEIERATNFLF
jgi:hypothetical protein